MKILVSGSSGLVGQALIPALQTAGHEIHTLIRSKNAAVKNAHFWDPVAGVLAAQDLEGFDAVVHLAGENIAGGRWSASRMQRIRDSRIKGTALLSSTLAACSHPPKVLVSASAIGIYGDRGDETCSEDTSPGNGFLPKVAQEWEMATKPAKAAGIRVVTPRLGVVLSKNGGALQKMLPAFRLGLGGRLGNGRQYMSWIEIDDLIRLLMLLLEDPAFEGPVNCVAPHPVSNAEFTATLAAVLHRPAFCHVPAMVLRLLLGQLADEALLASTKVTSLRLKGKFEFRYAHLADALRHTLH
ncbi:MAG: TIGR01777 family oxidoreductase [Deltaproteobacteria bacterium]|nr:TIGR01777 family oxidoreductase [Deltaproteobacteria bacterium]